MCNSQHIYSPAEIVENSILAVYHSLHASKDEFKLIPVISSTMQAIGAPCRTAKAKLRG